MLLPVHVNLMKVIILSVLYTDVIACTFYNTQCDNNKKN